MWLIIFIFAPSQASCGKARSINKATWETRSGRNWPWPAGGSRMAQEPPHAGDHSELRPLWSELWHSIIVILRVMSSALQFFSNYGSVNPLKEFFEWCHKWKYKCKPDSLINVYPTTLKCVMCRRVLCIVAVIFRSEVKHRWVGCPFLWTINTCVFLYCYAAHVLHNTHCLYAGHVNLFFFFSILFVLKNKKSRCWKW